MSGAVVYAFRHSIERSVMLAVCMPIIAGMGGNAGTQALAVTIRRIALGLIPPNRFLRVVEKEVLVGIINGLAVGLVVGVVAMFIGDEGPRRKGGRRAVSSRWMATCSSPASPARLSPFCSSGGASIRRSPRPSS